MSAVVSLMKQGVGLLENSRVAKKCFDYGGFVSLRLLFPLQYMILRELSDCSSILDLGCGYHSMVPILPKSIHITGVEGHKPYYELSLKKGRHDECLYGNICDQAFEPKSFDAVVMMDVIEHLSKEDGLMMIKRMQQWARKKVVLFTPNGFFEQHSVDQNPLMEHKSGWSTQEMQDLGFKVYGINGLKSLKKDHYDDGHKKSLSDYLIDLTQIYTYHNPKTASQIFCIQNLQT